MPVLAEDQLFTTCTSTIKLPQVKRTLALLQTVFLKAVWAAVAVRLASCVCTCPVRIWRADCRRAISSTDCAKKSRNVWMRAAIRARNGAATSANSTTVAPLLSLIKAAKRLRRRFPDAISISAMALFLLREACGARGDLDEQIRQRLRDVAAGLNVGEKAGRGARFQILCDGAS